MRPLFLEVAESPEEAAPAAWRRWRAGRRLREASERIWLGGEMCSCGHGSVQWARGAEVVVERSLGARMCMIRKKVREWGWISACLTSSNLDITHP